MPETLPMLETDPRRRFNTSRLLRVALFSVVAAMVIVSLLIVLVRFVWDRLVVPVVYSSNPEAHYYHADAFIVLPAMLVIAALIAKVLWDGAQRTAAPPRR